MEFSNIRIGTIQKRYKRFLADVTFDSGEEQTIYVPNTGSMKNCWSEGWKILAQEFPNTKRKYPFTLEMTHNGKTWIGINTNITNTLVRNALEERKITELIEYSKISQEVTIGKSRLDFLLEKEKEKYFLEVKNVTLNRENEAIFPDAVSTRGQKHLQELIQIKDSGQRAGLLFVVQREDVTSFNASNPIDPKYTELLYLAKERGVDILCYQCKLSPEKVEIAHPLPIVFP